MLKNLFEHKLQITVAALLVLLLVAIRTYEEALFYDPFLDYFKGNYALLPLPQIHNGQLALHLFFRYSLNTLISLGILYVVFKKIKMIRFSAVLYLLFFVILMVSLFVVITFQPDNKLVIFYIRRFLIQPLFLLLFLPAFYFQERAIAKNNVS